MDHKQIFTILVKYTRKYSVNVSVYHYKVKLQLVEVVETMHIVDVLNYHGNAKN